MHPFALLKRPLLVCLAVLLAAALMPAACTADLPPGQPSATAAWQSGTPAPTATAPSGTPASTDAPAKVTPAAPSPTIPPINISAAGLRGQVIRFWFPWTGSAGEMVKKLVDEFNLNNEWKIVVTPVQQGSLDELSANLAAAIQDGKSPELVVGYLHQALEWEQQLALVDMTPYVNDPQWGLTVYEQADFYAPFWEQALVSGRRLGLPAMLSGMFLYYNRTWARELGYTESPTTPEQFRQQACAAHQAMRLDDSPQNDGLGGWIIGGQDQINYAITLGWIFAYGGQVVSAPSNGESPYQFASPENAEALSYLRQLYDDGCTWLAESPYLEEPFANRLGLFASGSVLNTLYQSEILRQVGSQDEWTLLPFPSPDGEPAFDAYGPSYVLLASSPERQLAAWIFTRWLLAPENHARFVQVTGSLPVRQSSLEYLQPYREYNPQWAAAVDLLPYALGEPALRSWATVRWALGDASVQLFRSYYSIERVPELLEYLELTAAELHLGPEQAEALTQPVASLTAVATLTAAPTATPTATPTARATSTRAPTAARTPSPSPTP